MSGIVIPDLDALRERLIRETEGAYLQAIQDDATYPWAEVTQGVLDVLREAGTEVHDTDGETP